MNRKISSKKLHNILNNNMLIIFIFVILSIASVFFIRHNIIGSAFDITFHWSRIFEIKDSIIDGRGPFPKIMLNNFSQDGSAVMMAYPYINLFPAVLLSFFVKSFSHMLIILFVMRNLLSLIVAFYASLNFCKNKKISFLFSIGYAFSNIVLFYNFYDMDMGVTSALIYLPMVLFGFFELIDNRQWKELTFGLSAIMLCHVITAIMAIMLLLVLGVINFKKIKNRLVIFAIVKSIIITTLVSSFFWLPLLSLKISNNISLPIGSHELIGTSYNVILSTALDNEINECMTLVATLGVFLSIINYKNISGYSKQLFWVGISVLFITSWCFPWKLFSNTLLAAVLQRTLRLFIIAQLIFSYLFGESVIKLCKNKRNSIIATVAIIFVIMGTQISSQKSIAEKHMSSPFYFEPVNNKINMDKQVYIDYLPNTDSSLISDIAPHFATMNNYRKIKTSPIGNGQFNFKLNSKAKTLKLPFVIYNNINYEVKVNGKDSHFYADNKSQLTLNNLSKGEHQVQVIVHKSWYDYVSYVLSLLGVITLLFSWIKSLIIKRKSN